MIGVVLVALLVTLLVEIPIVAAFYPGQRTRMAIACAFATIFASLAVNALLRHVTSRIDAYVAIGQVAAMILEALVYFFVAHPRDLRRAFTAAAAANIASYAAGLLLG